MNRHLAQISNVPQHRTASMAHVSIYTGFNIFRKYSDHNHKQQSQHHKQQGTFSAQTKRCSIHNGVLCSLCQWLHFKQCQKVFGSLLRNIMICLDYEISISTWLSEKSCYQTLAYQKKSQPNVGHLDLNISCSMSQHQNQSHFMSKLT